MAKIMSKRKPRWDDSFPKYVGEDWKGNVVNVPPHETTNPDGTKSPVKGYRRRKTIRTK